MTPNGRWISSVLGKNGGNVSGLPGSARGTTAIVRVAPSRTRAPGSRRASEVDQRPIVAPRRTPPSLDSVVTRNIAMPSAATSASRGQRHPDRLAVLDASTRACGTSPTGSHGMASWLRADSVHGQPVHSAQRPPVDVFHQDVRELAVSANAVETVDASGPLEALTIRLVLVEKDRIRDRRARDVGAEESFPNAGDDRLEVVETEVAQPVFRHLPDLIADVAADIDGDDGLPLRREPRHGERPLGQSEEWEPRLRRPRHDVWQKVSGR